MYGAKGAQMVLADCKSQDICEECEGRGEHWRAIKRLIDIPCRSCNGTAQVHGRKHKHSVYLCRDCVPPGSGRRRYVQTIGREMVTCTGCGGTGRKALGVSVLDALRVALVARKERQTVAAV